MSFFEYQARDQASKSVRGVVEASDESHALALIRQRNLYVTNIRPKSKQQTFSLNLIFKRVGFGEVVQFTRQLSSMVSAGLQLPQALSLLQTQSNNPAFAGILEQIVRDLQGGGSLGDALAKHPRLFSSMYISLVRAGEASGNLDTVLARLAEKLEKERELRSRLRGAMIYPAVIILAMLVVVAALMVFVIPQISQLYTDFGFALPFTTQLLIGASNFTVSFWWLILLVGAGAAYGFGVFAKTDTGNRVISEVVFRLPIFGTLVKQITLVEFTATLGLLVGAGIHLLDSLKIVTNSIDNVMFREALTDISKKVEKGLPLGAAFSQHELFPAILPQMVKVGEETGKLDDSLTKLSAYFESESDQTVKGLTTAIEPLIIVVLGVGVGFVVLSIITPIYNLTSQF